MKVDRIGGSFAGRVTGIDIAAGVSARQREQVETALAEYPVLCFPEQTITDEQQTAFVHELGPAFEAPYGEVARKENNDARLIDIANVEVDGRQFEADSPKRKFYDANLFWHTDLSFSQRPMRITALSARALPTHPPDTEFADMRAAWNALPDEMKRRCEDILVEHSIFYSRRRIGMDVSEFGDDMRRDFGEPARHRLVRTHARSGRKSLYLSSHGGAIVGWPEREGAGFLEELTQFATQPQFVYAHKWRPHDLVMWDDSCTMHRATPYDGDEPRRLRWTGVQEREPLPA